MKELFDRSRAWLIAALVLICLAVLGISSAYTIRVLHLMRTDTDQYLLENAATAADNVNGRIQDDLANLELTARTCANLPDRVPRWSSCGRIWLPGAAGSSIIRITAGGPLSPILL